MYADVTALRSGVTTVVDAGGSGWRNFEDFKQRIIDRSVTRVLAMLNIVGHGMRGGKFEQDLQDMAAQPTADMARRYPAFIVGIKTAHYSGPEWAPVERAVEAGTLASLPVMVDFGSRKAERPLSDLVTSKLRPGDIYTHVYSGLRGEQDPSGRVNPALWEGRKRGVLFDVGHGGTSFEWRIAVPAVKEGFLPDVISTDLHVASMSGGMKDMANTLPCGGSKRAASGYIDGPGMRVNGTQKIVTELTVRGGKVVYKQLTVNRKPLTVRST